MIIIYFIIGLFFGIYFIESIEEECPENPEYALIHIAACLVVIGWPVYLLYLIFKGIYRYVKKI